MKLQKRVLFLIITVVILMSIFATSGAALASAPRVDSNAAIYPMAIAPSLGAAQSFAVLGASTVTNTGPTVISGDLGISPGGAVTGFPPGIVNGVMHVTDAVALNAQNSVTTAYNSLAGQACNTILTGQNLGGLTLTPGVYCFSTSAQLTGILTLDMQSDPNSVFVFKIGSTLTTASGSSVVTINGGGDPPCNVFWQVGSSATLGTYTTFAGNILAMASITMNTGATLTGRALARTGAVTMDTNTVSVSVCTEPPPSEFGVLEIFKFNDLNGNGLYEPGLGESPLPGWDFTITGPDSYSSSNTTDGFGLVILPGLVPGDYSANETAQSGWTVTTSNPQTGTVSAGDVTILNFGNREDDVLAPAQIRAFNYNDTDHDGNYDVGEPPLGGWQFCINGVCRITDDTGYTAYWAVLPGTYTIYETTRLGWINSDPAGPSSCKQITVTGDQIETLYFGNHPIVPPPSPAPPPPPSPSGESVGITVIPVDKGGLLMPWLGMAGLLLITIGIVYIVRKRVSH